MEKLNIYNVPLATRAVVDALVDALISAGIKVAFFGDCGLSPTALPALTRLLQSPGFERLSVENDRAALFEGPSLPAFCEALRNCKSLKKMELEIVNLWDDLAAALQLIAALEGLPTLQLLSLYDNSTNGRPAVQRAAGECLARLIARSRSLRVLVLSFNHWGEAGLAPIFEALKGNVGLVELSLRTEQISADFARNVVLPAVRANTCLRYLSGLQLVEAGEEEAQVPSLREVEDILEARRLADEEAA